MRGPSGSAAAVYGACRLVLIGGCCYIVTSVMARIYGPCGPCFDGSEDAGYAGGRFDEEVVSESDARAGFDGRRGGGVRGSGGGPARLARVDGASARGR